MGMNSRVLHAEISSAPVKAAKIALLALATAVIAGVCSAQAPQANLSWISQRTP